MSDEAQTEETVEIEVEQPESQADTEVEVDIPALVEQAKNPPQEAEKQEENPQSTETSSEGPEKKDFDPKKDRVDFTTPEQQAKFNDVYKQMKNSDTRNAMLTELLEKTVERLDAMEGRQRNEEQNAAEQVLLSEIMSANEDGDVEKLTKTIGDLTKFRTDGLKDGLKKEIIQEIVNKNEADKKRDAASVMDFMERQNDDGTYQYPWMQEDHPGFGEFLSKASKIGAKLEESEPDDPNLVYKVMERTNQEMMNWDAPKPEPKPQERTPDPMAGSNLTQQVPRNKIKMSPQEMEIARRLNVDPKKYAAHKQG